MTGGRKWRERPFTSWTTDLCYFFIDERRTNKDRLPHGRIRATGNKNIKMWKVDRWTDERKSVHRGLVKSEVVYGTVKVSLCGVIWKSPKSMWKMYFSREAICKFFWNAPNSNTSSISIRNLITWFYMFEKFEMPHLRVIVFGMWLFMPSHFSKKKFFWHSGMSRNGSLNWVCAPKNRPIWFFS